MAAFSLDSDDTQRDARRAELQRLVDGLPDAAVIITPDLEPLLWNRSYSAMVGLRPKKMLEVAHTAKPHCHALLQLSLCKSDCLARRTQQTQRAVRMADIEASAPLALEKQELVVLASAIPLRDGLVVEIYRDVTAESRVQGRYRQQLDAERARAELLEIEVKRRTADLQKSLADLQAAKDQLVHAEKMSSLGRFVAGIAHEMNNPIHFIYGNLDFLEAHVEKLVASAKTMKTLVSDDARAAVERDYDLEYVLEDSHKILSALRKGAERATTIVSKLRTFSRIGTESDRTRVDIAECVSSARLFMTHQLREANITLETDITPGMQPVFGNAVEIEQVLLNLLNNGVQASVAGQTVTLRAREERDHCVIDVIDHGSGIVSEILPKIFDPFFTTKAVGQGTGLGLSICHSIVSGHAGIISAESAGGTTRFRVELPVTAPSKGNHA